MFTLNRRIIFDSVTGRVLLDMGKHQSTVEIPPREFINGLDYVDLPYDAYEEEFYRAVSWHIDTITKLPVFDELAPVQPTYEELQVMVDMMSEGVI